MCFATQRCYDAAILWSDRQTDCGTQLWSQLCLDASLTINDSNKFLISLSAHASSNANIITPSHIPSMCLENIGMTFHFSSCRRTRHALKAQAALSGSGVQHVQHSSALPTGSDDEHLGRPCFSTFPSPGGPQISDTLADKYAPWIPVASSIRASPLSSQGSVSSTTHNTPSHNTSPTSHKYAIHEVKFETLVKLVDCSLRRMISDCKLVRQGGIVLSSDVGSPKLATISPTLFSPGYVKVLSIIYFHDSTDGLIPGDLAPF